MAKSESTEIAVVTVEAPMTVSERAKWVRMKALAQTTDSSLRKSEWELAAALYVIRSERLYREEYKTFDKYCNDCFDRSLRYANEMIEAYSVRCKMIEMSPETAKVAKLANQSQLQELSKLQVDQIAVFSRSVKIDGTSKKIGHKEFKSTIASVVGVVTRIANAKKRDPKTIDGTVEQPKLEGPGPIDSVVDQIEKLIESCPVESLGDVLECVLKRFSVHDASDIFTEHFGSPESIFIATADSVDIERIKQSLSESRSEATVLIQQMPMFESDEDTFKRLAYRLGEEKSRLISEVYGPTAGANDDAAESPPPAVEEEFELAPACEYPEVELTQLYERCDKDGKKIIYKTAEKLWKSEDKESLYSEEFELFWEAFPKLRRTQKGASYESWKKALGLLRKVKPWKHELPVEQFLVRRAKEYASSPTGKSKFAKMPTSWLNQGCWDDDPAAWKNGDNSGKVAQFDCVHPSDDSDQPGSI